MIVQVMTVAPRLPAAAWNTYMNGYPVGLIKAFSTSERLNRMAMRAAKPKTPLMRTEVTIERGTTTEALWISSAICVAPSAPAKAPAKEDKLTNQAKPILDQ